MGIAHFLFCPTFERAVPDYLPHHRLMVLMSGLVEAAASALLAFAPTRKLGAIVTVGLLLAVFPANIDMALHWRAWVGPGLVWLLWVRLPLQPLLIYWAWRVGGLRFPVQQ